MSQTKLSVAINRFNKGIVGSASVVDFPPDAATDLVNFKIEKDGSLKKRGGLSIVMSSQPAVGKIFHDRTVEGVVVPSLRHKHAVVDGIRSGSYLLLTSAERSVGSPAQQCDIVALDISNDLSQVSVEKLPVLETAVNWVLGTRPPYPVSPGGFGDMAVLGSQVVSSIDGRDGLFASVVRLTDDGIQVGEYPINIRDSWGVQDTRPVNVDDAPPTFFPDPVRARHKYNAYNQGFSSFDTIYENASLDRQAIPSRGHNPGIVIEFAGSKYLTRQPVSQITEYAPRGSSVFQVGNYNRNYGGTGTISLGSFVFPDEKEVIHSSSAIAFANRIFYAVNDYTVKDTSVVEPTKPPTDLLICFSKVVQNLEDSTTCTSQNNPANPLFIGSVAKATPLETDGGVIVIQEAGGVLGLKEFNNNLIVFAEKGVWIIDGPFSPLTYTTRKISDSKLLDKNSIAQSGEVIVFQAESSVRVIRKDVRSNNLYEEDLSGPSLADDYHKYKMDRFAAASGAYHDVKDNTVHWFSTVSREFGGYITKELVLDMATGGFYTYEYMLEVGSAITGIVPDPFGNYGRLYVISSSGFNGNNYVYKISLARLDDNLLHDQSLGYFGDFILTNSLFSAHLETGASTFGNASTAKSANYLVSYIKGGSLDEDGLPTSSLEMMVKWDFTASDVTGKWSPYQELYRPRRVNFSDDADDYVYTEDVVVSKHKIRGRGKSVKLRMLSPYGRTAHIYGWNLIINSNRSV